jgi:DNA-binding NarL/FixJ family response regulator
MTIRVLIADDQMMVRQCLRLLLEAQPDLEVVGEADNGRGAIELLDGLQVDVMLMDQEAPGLDGVSPTQRIHDQYPEVRIVVLSAAEDDAGVLSAVRAGAIGFLSKTASIEVLLETIRAAAQGQVTFSAATSAQLVQELRAPVEEPERLTGRELEVLGCLVQGLSNKEIAWQLRISEKTVKSHVSTILSKFGLESRTQAAMHATRTGLVSIGPSGGGGSQRLRECSVISLVNRRHQPLARVALT